MCLSKNTRFKLLVSSAISLLAACSAADVASPGSTGPVTIGDGNGGNGGGNGGGNDDAVMLDFVPAGGCLAGTVSDSITSGNTTITACTISNAGAGGPIVNDLDLSGLSAVIIDGPVFVGDDNASGTAAPTIKFAPGQVVIGASGNDYIVIARGAKIDAQGTPSQPIIFTSAADIASATTESELVAAASDGVSASGADSNGEWGGIIINGRAPINDCNDDNQTGGTVACVKSGEGASGLFGGASASDDSGTMRYVRVQYAGFRVNDEDELNGITFQGVGSASDFEFIQIHNNLDDGVEWFGGTANIKNLVVTGAGDDSLDWTDGWTGTAQFVVVDQSELRGDRGIEGDNRNGSNDLTPRSAPSIANFTFLGGASGDTGMVLRRGTAGDYINGIITDFQDAGIDIDDAATAAQADADALRFYSMLVAGNAENLETDDDAGDAAMVAAFSRDGRNNAQAADTTLNGLFPGATEGAVVATTPSSVNSVLADIDATGANVDYIGAFAPGTTASSAGNWAAGWTIGLPFDGSSAGCPTGTVETATAVPAGRTEERICILSSGTTITQDITLTRGNLYQLEGAVFFGNDNADSATLTVDAGVTLFGSTGNDYLVISRGSQIVVNGTAQSPVIMTSREDINGNNVDDGNDANGVESDANGQWGGVIISGNAPINDCNDNTQTGGTVACVKSGEGGSGLFGGSDAADDSGSITYLRVQYAGFRVNDEDELNGIAFQGTGSGLGVDYVQIHNNLDDGLEWFGGTTSAKHLVITGAGDDSLDWTDGWVGNVQYAIVSQSALRGDRGIEADNRNGNNDITPRSNPTFSNFTFLGGAAGDTGMVLRRGTGGLFANGIITGFQDAGIDIDDAATAALVGADELNFRSLFVGGNAEDLETDDDAGDVATLTAFDETGANNAQGLVPSLSVGSDDTGITATLVPGANVTGATATDPSAFDNFFDAATYVGAVENDADNWYVGWTIGL